MSIELQYALVAASFLAVIWWGYHLAVKPRAPAPKKFVTQPWDNDRQGGRGNR
jgi:hypothetical protein